MVRRAQQGGKEKLAHAHCPSQTPLVPDETRILILGQSNTRGVQLVDERETWPNLLANALPEVLGGPVSLTVRPFFAHAPGALAYLEREVVKHEPDIAFLMLTTFPFTSPVIEPAVRRRFGDRVGNLFSRSVNRFDGATRHRSPLVQRLNRATRSVMVRLLRARPVTTYPVAMEGTVAAMEALSRREELQVLAFHGFVKLPAERRGRESKVAAESHRFLNEARREAERLHIAFLNMQDLPETKADGLFFPDCVHVTAQAHRLVAEYALAAFQHGGFAATAARARDSRSR